MFGKYIDIVDDGLDVARKLLKKNRPSGVDLVDGRNI